MSDWSYLHGMPRSAVHYAKYGTYDVPPRQYRFGGRRYAGRQAASDGGWIWILAALLGIAFLAKKK